MSQRSALLLRDEPEHLDWTVPSHHLDWTDREVINEEHNFRRMADRYYAPSEEHEKEMLVEDVIRDLRMYARRSVKPKTFIGKLNKLVENQEWSKILDAIEFLQLDIRKGSMSRLTNELIVATFPEEEIVKDNLFVRDTLTALNTHLKDVKIYFDLGMRSESLSRVKRCIEILQMANAIKNVAKDQGLEPVKSHEIMRVGEVGGRPIYEVKGRNSTNKKRK